MEAIEKTKEYNGLYFVLWGTKSGLSKGNSKKLENKIDSLLKRIKKDKKIKEVIIALDPTPKNESTSLWLERKLKDLSLKVTRLGRGLPFGGELEYADRDTLSSALKHREK